METVYIHISFFVPFPKPETKYKLSSEIHSHKAGTKYPDESPLYLVKHNFFISLNQPLLVMRSQSVNKALERKVEEAVRIQFTMAKGFLMLGHSRKPRKMKINKMMFNKKIIYIY